ncbi:MAG: hypothetical protein LBT66_09050 [Methanobrevibacter sp.]|jgi:hypothetical protein|nr:hypothetical protein [Candidatus Methanovirga meridionalis]
MSLPPNFAGSTLSFDLDNIIFNVNCIKIQVLLMNIEVNNHELNNYELNCGRTKIAYLN